MHKLCLLHAGVEEPSPMSHKPHTVLQSRNELIAFILLHEGNLMQVQPMQARTKTDNCIVLPNPCCHLWMLTQYAVMGLNDLLPLPSVSL